MHHACAPAWSPRAYSRRWHAPWLPAGWTEALRGAPSTYRYALNDAGVAGVSDATGLARFAVAPHSACPHRALSRSDRSRELHSHQGHRCGGARWVFIELALLVLHTILTVSALTPFTSGCSHTRTRIDAPLALWLHSCSRDSHNSLASRPRATLPPSCLYPFSTVVGILRFV